MQNLSARKRKSLKNHYFRHRIFLTLVYLVPAFTADAQSWEVELMAGVSGYAGDLTENAFDAKLLRPALNANVRYRLNNSVSLRAGVGIGQVRGNDKYNTDSMLLMRNLSFESTLLEGNLCVEFNLLPSDLFDNYPYVFAGLGVFRFNPYAYDRNNNKVELHPLRTEGQGFSEFPDRKKYNLTQLCIPFGAGIRFKLNSSWAVCAEAGFRKLFTDYLDDVSTSYVDAAVLLDRVGPKAAEMSYRGNEVGSPFFDPYPATGAKRGNPGKDDWYYFVGIKITWTPGANTLYY